MRYVHQDECMTNLRKNLDEIIHTNGGDNWWRPELFLKYTKNKLPTKIEVLENPQKYNDNYNCFIYALGLNNDKDLIKNCSGFIYDTFFQKLLNERIFEYTNNPQKGDYIFYKDLEKHPNMITHVGVLEDEDTVVSKWAWGPLLRHKIFDVPESYGNDTSYVKAIPKEKAKELYEKYKKFNKKSN